MTNVLRAFARTDLFSTRSGGTLLLILLLGWAGSGDGWAQSSRGPTDTTTAVASEPDSVDAALAARLQNIYREVEAFRDVQVQVRHRVVHLSGTVLQPQQATEAAALARSMNAVVYVSNDISAQADLADRVSPVLTRFENYGAAFVDFLPVGLIAVLVVLGTTGLARWIGGWEGPVRMRVSPMVWGLVRRVVQVAVALVGLVITLDLLGVTSLVGAVLGTAGVAGLAVGFAFRDIIENYLAGVLLSVRQPFRVNDIVSMADHEGRVVRLTAREAIRLVKQAFDEADIEMPEPTYRLQLYQAGEAAPHAPKGPDRPVAEQVDRIDVVPDRRLERKVEDELRRSDEPNLLSG